MIVGAPKEMQPWIRTVDSRQTKLDSGIRNLTRQVESRSVPDVAVFVDGAAHEGAAGKAVVTYPANSSVRHTNTSGLIEVTVSATMRSAHYGVAGVGFFLTGSSPTLLNGVPKHGVAFQGGVTEMRNGTSYTSVLSIRPGTHEFSMYYYTDTTTDAASTAAIDLATIIVRPL